MHTYTRTNRYLGIYKHTCTHKDTYTHKHIGSFVQATLMEGSVTNCWQRSYITWVRLKGQREVAAFTLNTPIPSASFQNPVLSINEGSTLLLVRTLPTVFVPSLI